MKYGDIELFTMHLITSAGKEVRGVVAAPSLVDAARIADEIALCGFGDHGRVLSIKRVGGRHYIFSEGAND